MARQHSVDGIGLMLEDAHKVEIEPYPDGGVMLWVYLHEGQAPMSIGVYAHEWEKVKQRYARFLPK